MRRKPLVKEYEDENVEEGGEEEGSNRVSVLANPLAVYQGG